MTDMPSGAIDIGWTCKRFASHLQAGAPDLSPTDAAMLAMHLETCDKCRSLLAEYLEPAPTALPESFRDVAGEMEAGHVVLYLDHKAYPLAAAADVGGAFAAEGLSITTLVSKRFASRTGRRGADARLVAGPWSWPIALDRLEDLRPDKPDVLRFAAGQKTGSPGANPLKGPLETFRYTSATADITILATSDDRVLFTITDPASET